jgi:hypothetical protein
MVVKGGDGVGRLVGTDPDQHIHLLQTSFRASPHLTFRVEDIPTSGELLSFRRSSVESLRHGGHWPGTCLITGQPIEMAASHARASRPMPWRQNGCRPRGLWTSIKQVGHAPVLGGCGTTPPKTGRRVTRKALLSQRIDGSGQSQKPPATTYSVFTADRSIARRAESCCTRPRRRHHVGLTNNTFSWLY